jgi:putative ABC transport system permease protein
VSGVKYAGVDAPDEGTVYSPLAGRSAPPPPAEGNVERGRYLVVRTASNPAATMSSVRQVLRQMDPGLPFSDVATADELVAQSLEQPRSLSLLVGTLAGAALLLSMIGIYGVMAYYVQQQMKEISIRLALGATRRDVLSLVLRQGMTVVFGGLLVGLAAALFAGRGMANLLFDVRASDPLPFSIVALLMATVAFLACLVPARRATRMDPAAVLRTD